MDADDVEMCVDDVEGKSKRYVMIKSDRQSSVLPCDSGYCHCRL
jgi:hypothetical protein